MTIAVHEQARQIYAEAIAADGPGWANTANNIRAGYENIWIKAGIRAVENTLRGVHDDHEEGRA
jgi:hypothetical protein